MSFKKFLLASSVSSLAFTGLATSALAEDKSWYIQAEAGLYTDVEDASLTVGSAKSDFQFQDEGSYGVALGYDWGNFRAQLDYQKVNIEIDSYTVKSSNTVVDLSGDVDVATYSGSVFYDFNNGGKIVPYVGVGLGVAATDLGETKTSAAAYKGGEETVSFYSYMVGVEVATTDSLSIYTEYQKTKTDRYDEFSNVYMDVVDGLEIGTVSTGIRFKF